MSDNDDPTDLLWEAKIEDIRSMPNLGAEAKRKMIAHILSVRYGREVSPDEVVVIDGPVVDAEAPETHDTSVYLEHRLTDDGRIIGVLPLTLGQAQIVMGRADSWVYTDEWMYATRYEALAAFHTWMIAPEMPEPQGWTRHKPSDRRRYYDDSGNVSREEVRP